MIDELLQQFQAGAPLCPTQIWKPEISSRISNASDSELFGGEPSTDTQREMRLACRAGLLLFNDDLEASHNLSQQIETPTGSFWHAILHRREGDFSNANYWWRKTGEHPVFADVYTEAMSTLIAQSEEPAREFSRRLETAGVWQPMEFVALCEDAALKNEDPAWLRALQFVEMQALLNWCRERAN